MNTECIWIYEGVCDGYPAERCSDCGSNYEKHHEREEKHLYWYAISGLSDHYYAGKRLSDHGLAKFVKGEYTEWWELDREKLWEMSGEELKVLWEELMEPVIW